MGSGGSPADAGPAGLQVGQRVTVEIERVAHGGHCVARHEGQVLFVRHALPGESVQVEVTSLGRKGRFVRADAVAVLRASPDRRVPPCPVAAHCGGCDWQHATPQATRRLKEAVVREALLRFAGESLPAGFEVVEVDGAAGPLAGEGLGWRTRGTASADPDGRAGFRAHHSHEVVAAGACPQLHPALAAARLFDTSWPPGSRIGFVAPARGAPLAFPAESPPPEPVRERAAGREWEVAADGFWQVHPGAADALVAHVRRMLAPRRGEHLVDLYAGVGLFGLALADGVPDLAVTLVEADRQACALAERNRRGSAATVVRAPVDRYVARPAGLAGADLVVLDPPRTGAGQRVVQAIAAARPRAIAYVACDPVALARDLATLAALGYRLADLVALDLFPTTHHVECVAHLVPA